MQHQQQETLLHNIEGPGFDSQSTINLFELKYLLIEKNLERHLSKANEKRIIVMVVGHFGVHAHP